MLSVLSAFERRALGAGGGHGRAQPGSVRRRLLLAPSADLQRNLTNLAVFKMILESHSLKTAVARFHLTTPQALRELQSKPEADAAHRQIEALRKELEAIEDVDRADFEALRQLGFGTHVGAAEGRPTRRRRGRNRAAAASNGATKPPPASDGAAAAGCPDGATEPPSRRPRSTRRPSEPRRHDRAAFEPVRRERLCGCFCSASVEDWARSVSPTRPTGCGGGSRRNRDRRSGGGRARRPTGYAPARPFSALVPPARSSS